MSSRFWDPDPRPAPKQTEMNVDLETSKQESGVPVAELLSFLRRESVSSEPEGDKAKRGLNKTRTRAVFSTGKLPLYELMPGWPGPPAQLQLSWERSLCRFHLLSARMAHESLCTI